MSSENLANDARRFTLLVTERALLPETEGILVSGQAHGMLKTGDDVYLVDPQQRVLTSSITEIRLGNDFGAAQTVAEATDCLVTLRLSSVASEDDVPKYTVVTNIRPQQAIDPSRGIENGQLLGLMTEFNQYSGDPQYISVLVYSLCHSHFLAATIVTGAGSTEANGKVNLNAESNLEFPLLHDQNDSKIAMLPIFTDLTALNRWKGAFQSGQKTIYTVLHFPNVVSNTREINGTVVNPFGPGTFVLPNDFIDSIIATRGYQEEFGQPSGTIGKLRETKVESEQQIRIVVPAEDDELRLIREEILADVRRMPYIKEVYLLIKLNSADEPSYYCVVDCPLEAAKAAFAAIARDITPFLRKIERIEFIPSEAITLPDSIAAACRIYP